jgi:hypothetical protein
MTAQDAKVLPRRAIRLIMMSTGMLALIASCTERPSLTVEEKTRFVSELIAERAECNTFRQKLSVPAKDAKALNDLYDAAKAAFCLKPDV